MKLKRLTRTFKANAKPVPEMKSDIRNIMAHLKEHVKPGIPYSIGHIMDDLDKNRLMDLEPYYFSVLRICLERLITKHGWCQTGGRGHFCIPGKKPVVLRDMIDAMIPHSAPCTRQSTARTIKYLTGEDVDTNTISKVFERLIEQGRFIRLERGKYKRTHIGF